MIYFLIRIKNGKGFEGLGEIKFFDGRLYQGLSKNGIFQGKGRLIEKNGNIYQGYWKDGALNGSGFFFDKKTKKIYEGLW